MLSAFRLEWPDGVTVYEVDAVWSPGRDYDPAGWLRASGWSVDSSVASAVAERYGRPLSPYMPEGMLTSLLVTAHKPGRPRS